MISGLKSVLTIQIQAIILANKLSFDYEKQIKKKVPNHFIKEEKMKDARLFIVLVLLAVVEGFTWAGGQGEGQGGQTSGELLFGHLGSEETVYQQGALRFAEELKKATDGNFSVKIYPNGQMGDEEQLFEQQMNGQLDFSIVNPSKIVEFSNTANIFGFPFMFKSVDQWNAVLSGPLGKEISDKIYEETDVKVIGYFGGGVRNIVSRVELKSIDSLKGMKLRTNQTKAVVAAWKALGANPVPYAYNEVYTGLQTGAIDGLLNEAEWVEIMGFHEVAPYIGQSEHEITVRFFTMSGQTWRSLAPAAQEAVMEAAAKASEFAREKQVKVDQKALERIKEEGATLVPMDREKMAEIVMEPVMKVGEEQGLAELYQKIREYKE